MFKKDERKEEDDDDEQEEVEEEENAEQENDVAIKAKLGDHKVNKVIGEIMSVTVSTFSLVVRI